MTLEDWVGGLPKGREDEGAVVIDMLSRRRANSAPEELVTKAAVARHLSCGTKTVERYMARGLPFVKPFEHGSVRFRLSDVDAFMDGH